MHPIAICHGCVNDFAYDFTAVGTEHLAPQIVRDIDLAALLRQGWHVTYHAHEEAT